MRRAFVEGDGPAQGVRVQEGSGGLPCRNQPGEGCHAPRRQKQLSVQGTVMTGAGD